MNDLLDFIAELKELQHLYKTGDLRDFDFQTKITQREHEVAKFESAMEEQHDLFFGGTPFKMSNEV
jgi:hypothetical protein